MTDEREEALRWADECVPMLEQLAIEQCSAHLRHAADVMEKLIRLARPQPQQEPVTVASIFCAIQHGDTAHRAWLLEALNAHFAGQPIPPSNASPLAQAVPEGSIVLTEEQFEYFMQIMTEPAEPTEAIRQGAALLKSISVAPKPGGRK